MMCPDHGAIDHVGGAIATRHFRQRFEHCIEHAGLDPSSVASKHAVPLAIFVRQVPPLRTRPRHPHHTFEIQPVVLGRTASPTSLRRQKRANQRPLRVRHANPLTQRCLPKDSLESTPESQVKLCPRNLVLYRHTDTSASKACRRPVAREGTSRPRLKA
jgi:hypothetical protein